MGHDHNLVTLLDWVSSADSVTITLEFWLAPEAMHVSMARNGKVLMGHAIYLSPKNHSKTFTPRNALVSRCLKQAKAKISHLYH